MQPSKFISPNNREVLYAQSSITGKSEYIASTNHAIDVTATITPALVSSPLVGQAKIASTGTAVRLNGGTSQPLTNGLIISAVSGNNASGVTIGGSGVTNTADGTGNGYILAPGASVSFAIADTNEIWINGTTADFVSWAGS